MGICKRAHRGCGKGSNSECSHEQGRIRVEVPTSFAGVAATPDNIAIVVSGFESQSGMWSRANYRARENDTGQWRRELRSPYRRAPWDAPDAPRVGTSDVDGGGRLISRTAGLTLLEGIGKTL